jgi:hypothetical protein
LGDALAHRVVKFDELLGGPICRSGYISQVRQTLKSKIVVVPLETDTTLS